MSSQILLFSGSGTGPFCTEALESKLKILDDRYHLVKKIASFPDCFSDPSSISAVCVPGGNAAEMILRVSPNAKSSIIELFNEHHPSYYGACAGGILASSGCFETRSYSDTTLECLKNNSYPLLSIFPGKVVVPIFPKPVGKLSLTDFRLFATDMVKTTSQMLTPHILSPGFLDVDQIDGAQTLSTYHALPVIRSAPDSAGPGLVIDPKRISESLLYQPEKGSKMFLTGSHYEIDSKAVLSGKFKAAFGATNLEQQKISEQLEVGDSARDRFLTENFQKIGLHCRV